jgi:hypothetical protein
MRRQEILYRPDKRFHFVLTEAALRYRLCAPDVMLGQLDRLISFSQLPIRSGPPGAVARPAAGRAGRVGVRCVLARRRRLVLRYNVSPCEPSGLTDPQLHVFTSDGSQIATTDGVTYTLADGCQHPVSDPDAAAALIVTRLYALPRA